MMISSRAAVGLGVCVCWGGGGGGAWVGKGRRFGT